MDCPECGAPLVTYRLDGREAPVCEACGHVGIDAEHRPARLRVESWGEALRRFYGSDDDVSVPVDAGMTEPDRTQPETWAAALERFYRDADRDGRQEPTADAASEAQPEPATVAFEGRPAVRRNESG
jgi:uncharacterized Zn finger protein (UPF0148 family)